MKLKYQTRQSNWALFSGVVAFPCILAGWFGVLLPASNPPDVVASPLFWISFIVFALYAFFWMIYKGDATFRRCFGYFGLMIFVIIALSEAIPPIAPFLFGTFPGFIAGFWFLATITLVDRFVNRDSQNVTYSETVRENEKDRDEGQKQDEDEKDETGNQDEEKRQEDPGL